MHNNQLPTDWEPVLRAGCRLIRLPLQSVELCPVSLISESSVHGGVQLLWSLCQSVRVCQLNIGRNVQRVINKVLGVFS